MTETKIAMTIEEASEYTGIGRNTMRNLVEWGKLPVLKVGRKVLIKSDILEKFMEVNEGKNLRDKGDVKAVTRKSAV
ncbi:helix-turn-helix domain-containing protein [Lachnospiraceae bacterium JLR.KK008]|jgi:excisionase family DNA binding protein|uniref:helix-turn-helix domain-containing protein n=1 Tax=Clostridia TaxID=186801 RepID=UPI00203A658C|nr:helix-turn-helix domain-containing protein [Mediterraneibacter agrestimuris]